MEIEKKPSRMYYLDFAKASAIVFMILIHTMQSLGGEAEDIVGVILNSFLGGFMAAPVFMTAMGVGFGCTRQQNPNHFISRGLNILCLGYILNLVRYLPLLIYEISLGEFTAENLVIELIEGDILHFSGLAMILFGLLKKLKLSDTKILIAAIAMSLINMAIPMITSDSLVLNGTAGHFIFVSYPGYEEGTFMDFPLFAWFIFPAFGYWLINRLNTPEKTEKFFKIALIPCLVVSMGASIFEYINNINMMTSDSDVFYYKMITIDAMISLCYVIFCFALFFFICKFLCNNSGEKILKGVSTFSNALNLIFMIHWVLEYLIAKVIIYEIMGISYNHLLGLGVSTFIAVAAGFLGIWAKAAIKNRLTKKPNSILRFIK